MRKIIFRAKNLDDWTDWLEGREKNLPRWFYGDLMNDGGESRCLYFQENGSDMQVDPDTVGQFTGAYDCKGNYIFEHDFVVFDDGGSVPKIVLHSKNYAEFRLYHCTMTSFTMGYSHAIDYTESRECFKVVGNLFDTPDLISKQVHEKIMHFLREEQ